MSGSAIGNKKVANRGTGINGRLLSAVVKDNVKAVKKYLKYGADPNVIMADKRSALHLAAVGGNVDVMQLLLNAGADPSPLDQYRRTPLHVACMPPHIGSIQTLLYGGANPNAGNQYQSALHCAIAGGNLTAVNLLVDSGADVNVMGFIDYNGSCLSASAFEVVLYTIQDPDLLSYLIQNGCVPRAKELKSSPFLTFRCRTFKRSLLALLLRLVQDGTLDIATVKKLCDMLEASGYELQDDPFFKHLMGLLCNMSSGSTGLSSPRTPISSKTVLLPDLTQSQLRGALQLFHWGGLSDPPTDEMVNYVQGLVTVSSRPKEVPNLASLCRLRVRSRFTQVHKKCNLQALVDQLPLPSLHKRFLMIQDLD
ncbi:ankyrin repeat-containing protein [Plakobranchus ocellatus]|uniref:Ankyrin repeat-containing protein n=1 Tax=Plakobranchus ocellatus TaxID=259542 RepID=A0AAV3Y7Q5_9GAST|nr:ankyrin repeat-containing protein [Plakobranchus ocellatus]